MHSQLEQTTTEHSKKSHRPLKLQAHRMSIAFNIPFCDFSENYQEKKPLLIKDAVSKNYFTWKEANEVFNNSDVASEDLKLFLNGLVPKKKYTEEYLEVGTLRHRLLKPVVYEHLKNGATLIANKIRHSAKVEHLSRQVATFTGRQVVSSAYVALGEKESSPCHWDTRDVFAIQLIGRKRWTIYEPSMDSPIFTQQSKDFKDQHPCPVDPHMDIILEAGDVLYIPRGWWHNPQPLGEPTFHLSVGTFPALVIDYLSWLFKNIESYADSRKSLKNWEQDWKNLDSVSNHISSLINNPENYRHFTDEFNGALRIDSPLALELLGSPDAKTIPEHLGVRLCANCYSSVTNDYIIANGTRVNLDLKSKKIINSIVKNPGFSISNLSNEHPDISASALTTIITQLCQQDILELINS